MPPLNESETRARLIDPALREKGWFDHVKMEAPAGAIDIVSGRGRRRERGRIDYLMRIVLLGHSQPLPIGLMEAKKESASAHHGLEQGKDYAERMSKRHHIQFVYSSNGHLFVEYDRHTGLTSDPRPMSEFPSTDELRKRYEDALGISLAHPSSLPLFTPYPHGEAKRRYYQDAAIRAVLEKLAVAEQHQLAMRALLAIATGGGKTYIAVNLLKRIADAGQLTRALFLCDRDELRTQALLAFSNEFGNDAREVKEENGRNIAGNARIHIATYQTLGIDTEDGDASFLTRHYPENHFTHIVIDECHRSAWGKWRAVLDRNPDAAHIGLTATPRHILLGSRTEEARKDELLRADNHNYFGDPVYEYTLAQAQEDGYLAACEIIQRTVNIDQQPVTHGEVMARDPVEAKTHKQATEDQIKQEYNARVLDKDLIVPERAKVMSADLFQQLLQHGANNPEQKTIVFCAQDTHADRVASELNNCYAAWCKQTGKRPKDNFAFKCTADSQGGGVVPDFRGSRSSYFIATTVDLLSTGVDIPCLNNVVFFRYVASPILFYQMVGRGTRIDEATDKYMFRLYDYTNLIGLFGQEFVTPPSTGGGGKGGESTPIETTKPTHVEVGVGGHFVLGSDNGKSVPVAIEEYKARLRERMVSEAKNLAEFRQLWIEARERKSFIDHLVQSDISPNYLQEIEHMQQYDLFDVLGRTGYSMNARTRMGRESEFLHQNEIWLNGYADKPRAVIKAFASQFALGGTEALESEELGRTPLVRGAGGIIALRGAGESKQILQETKRRLFAV